VQGTGWTGARDRGAREVQGTDGKVQGTDGRFTIPRCKGQTGGSLSQEKHGTSNCKGYVPGGYPGGYPTGAR
jgi:hypothetical protein